MANVLNQSTQSIIRPVQRTVVGSIVQSICLPRNLAVPGGEPSGPPEFIAHSSLMVTSPGATYDIPVVKPTGTQEGDLVVLITNNRNSFLALPTGGSTWIEKFNYNVLASSITTPITGNEGHYLWYKVAGASEPAEYTVAFTDDGAWDGAALICMTFRNAPVVGDFAVVTGKIAPTVTAEEGDTLISWHGTVSETSNASTVVQPAGMTLVDKIYHVTPDVGLATAYELDVSAGAVGAKTWVSAWTAYHMAGNILIRAA